MDTDTEHGINDLLGNARQSVPVRDTAQQFESIIRRMDEPQALKQVSYAQMKVFVAAACIAVLVNIAAWALSRSDTRQGKHTEPYYLQSYDLNIY